MRKRLIALICAIAMLILATSCAESNVLLSTETMGDVKVELYGVADVVKEIVVIKGDRKTCTLKVDGTSFESVDLDLDGYPDILLESAKDDGRCSAYIYQPKVGVFTENQTISEMRHPIFSFGNNCITSRIEKIQIYEDNATEEESGYKETRAVAVWQWIGGILTQTGEFGIEHDSNSDIYCVYRSTLLDGLLVRDDPFDKWCYADGLEKLGLSWDGFFNLQGGVIEVYENQ